MTPFSSEIAFTIKFGAFPIYVFAPINTAPQEIAVRVFTEIVPRVVPIPLVNKCSCCCKEYKIRRRIIKETGKRSRRPEHLRRCRNPKLRSHCFQKHKRWLHGNKNSDKKYRDFFDRAPGKMVSSSDFRVCRLERQPGSSKNDHDFNDRRKS